MIDSNQNAHGLINPGTRLVSREKHQPAEARKTALRDLQNANTMVALQTANRGPTLDSFKVSGTKRSTPEFPMGPPCRQSPSSNGTNGNFVYMRRKSEQEGEKINTFGNLDNNGGCPQSRQFSHGIQETPRQQIPVQGPKGFSAFAHIPGASLNPYPSGGPSLPVSLGKPVDALPVRELNHPAGSPAVIPLDSQKEDDQHFMERFHRLQAFLKSYDNSSHEEYTQMLRALTSAGRSKHAVELEKRAIHLLLEEKKELERMKVLNVLGKATPKDNASPSATPASSGK
ncbi:hypothetical protein IFM89_039154 [Coptis chinensis]|uniref:Uncharacterized protein n=1 Tax=Coptis chinensis TaxID=261450 RepID=A0A835HSP2_9MAGN|nr:hypothetical protein IFM89_039154 [Coptis chinensis]